MFLELALLAWVRNILSLPQSYVLSHTGATNMVSASPLPPPPPASRAFPSSVPPGLSLLRPSTQLPFERPDPHDEESATLIRKRDGTADPSASFSSSSLGGDVPLDAALALGSSTSTSTVPMNPTDHLAHSTTISDVHFIAGNHADFYLLGSKGIGGSESLAQVKRALQEQRPDVLLVQICPTRLRLLLDPDASIWSYLIDIHAAISSSSSGQVLGVEGGFSPYHMLAGATPLLNFSRFSSLVLARLVWKAVAVLVGQRRTFAHEFVQSIRLAATTPVPGHHTRVVLGGRDLPTTLARAWLSLSAWDRLGVVKDVALLSLPCLSGRTACQALGLSPPFLPIPRGSDAMSQVLRFFAHRHPSLAPLEKEGGDYFLSSMQKLDRPVCSREGGREGTGEERMVVLAVVGASLIPHIQRNWGIPVDRRRLISCRGPRGGGWAWPCVGMVILVLISYMLCQSILFLSAPSQQTFGVVRHKDPSMAF